MSKNVTYKSNKNKTHKILQISVTTSPKIYEKYSCLVYAYIYIYICIYFSEQARDFTSPMMTTLLFTGMLPASVVYV